MNETFAELLAVQGVIITIQRLTEQYRTKFRSEPHYAKLPKLIYPQIQSCTATVLHEGSDARDKDFVTVMGLIACPTSSITTINEIEVF